MILIDLFNQIGKVILLVLGWLFSASSAGILTVITGLIAWYVYYSQVKLREKESAIVLLNEIKNTEKSLDSLKDGVNFQSEISSILPTCSWDKNYQIFARYLSRDEFDLLSSFFNNCKAAQKEQDKLRLFFLEAMNSKVVTIQKYLLDLAEKYKEDQVVKDNQINPSSEYAKKRDAVLKIFHQENYWFLPNAPKEEFLKYVKNIQRITGTTVAAKLGEIAREK